MKTFLGKMKLDNLFLERGVGTFAGFLDFADPALHFFEGFGDRFDEVGDGLFAFCEFSLSLFLFGLESAFGEVKELLLGELEGVGGESLEGIGKTFFYRVEKIGRFEVPCLLGLDLMLKFALAFE